MHTQTANTTITIGQMADDLLRALDAMSVIPASQEEEAEAAGSELAAAADRAYRWPGARQD